MEFKRLFNSLTKQEKIDLSFQLIDESSSLSESIKMAESMKMDVSKLKDQLSEVGSKLESIKADHKDILTLCYLQALNGIKSELSESEYNTRSRDSKINLVVNDSQF